NSFKFLLFGDSGIANITLSNKQLIFFKYNLKIFATCLGSCPNTPHPYAPNIKVSVYIAFAISKTKLIRSKSMFELISSDIFLYFWAAYLLGAAHVIISQNSCFELLLDKNNISGDQIALFKYNALFK